MISPHPPHCLLSLRFLIVAILVCINWHLIVCGICVCLMTGNTEHLFMCLSAICLFSLQKCSVRFFVHFLINRKISIQHNVHSLIREALHYIFHHFATGRLDPSLNMQCYLSGFLNTSYLVFLGYVL